MSTVPPSPPWNRVHTRLVLSCLERAVVLRAADPHLRIGGRQRPVVELDIGDAGTNLREGHAPVRRAEEAVVAADVDHARRDRIQRELLALVQIAARDRHGGAAVGGALEVRTEDVDDGRIGRVGAQPGIVDGGRRGEAQREGGAVGRAKESKRGATQPGVDGGRRGRAQREA